MPSLMRVHGILNQPYCLLTIRLNRNKKVKTQIVSQTVMTWQALKKSWNVSYKTWRKHSATTRNKKNLKYIEVVKLWISYKRCFSTSFFSSFSLKLWDYWLEVEEINIDKRCQNIISSRKQNLITHLNLYQENKG